MTTSSTNQRKQTSAKEEWTDPEKWVWEQVCKGEMADFNFKYNKDLDPRKEEGWNEERLISPEFLETILFEDSYCNFLHRNGVSISGAWIKEKLNLSRASINIELQLIKSRFESNVDLTLLKCSNTISFDGSAFTKSLIFSYARIESYLNLIGVKVSGELDMNTLSVGSSLFMRDSSEFNYIMLRSAKVGGHLDLSKAKVTGTLDMDSITIDSGLVMRDKSEFNDVILIGAKIQGYADMSGTKVTGTLNMDSISVGSSMFMHTNAEFNNVYLSSAKINGQLDMSGAKVSGILHMDKLTIGSSLFIQGAELNEITLLSAEISGQLDMSRSKVKGKLNLDSMILGSHLFLRNNAEFKDISILGARIGGQFDMTGVKVTDEFYIESTSIEKNVFLRAEKYEGYFSLILSNINGSVYISDAEISQLDLGGTNIRGELHIGSAGKKINWKSNSFMNLRNTEIGAIMDAGEDSWPDELNLDGFTYSRLGGLFGQDVLLNKQIAERDSEWFIKWMAKDKSYSPQPYHQLAGILNKMGYPDKANAVLYAAKNREKDDAKHSKLWLRWFGLNLMKWIIGYGFGGRYFRSLIWVLCLSLLGVFVLTTIDTTSVPNIWDKIGFSIDMLLPIISLDERYKLDFSGWQLYYFYFHKLMGFLLGSFVVAGLSGITKK